MKRLLIFAFTLSCIINASAQSVVFSKAHGFYNKAFSLQMHLGDDELLPGQSIRYTLDGSVPTANSRLYSSQIHISTNTILRAAIVGADTLASPVTTATYLFANDVIKQSNTPNGYPSTWGDYCDILGTAIADYEMDPEMVNDATLKNKILNGLTEIPTLSIVTDKDNFFSKDIDEEAGGIYIYTGAPVGPGTGRDWERPVSVELFGGKQNHNLTVDCGVKIHGGHSRLPEKTPKHSLRLMFKSKYGPSKLKYRVFGEEGPKKFDQLVLRCAFGNTWEHWDNTNRKRAQYARDMWARATQARMGHPNSKGLYVHVYINGMYWGLYNIAERINDYYCSSNFGGEKEDYDVIKVEDYRSGNTIEPADGTIDKWKEMIKMARNAGSANSYYCKLQGLTTTGERSEEYEPLLDVDNFIDFMLINQYGGNTDWDHHNWLAYRNRTSADQGFKFICWDSELIFGDLSQDVTGVINAGAPTDIFNELINNNGFRHRYMDHVYRHMVKRGGILTPEKVVEIWDSLYHIIELPLYDEAARWGDYRRDVHPYNSKGELYTVDGRFMKERNRLLNTYFPDRTNIVLNQIKARGWYSDINMPQLRINGALDEETDTISYSDVVTLTMPSVTYITLDGSDPASWLATSLGKSSPTAKRYTGKNILTEYGWEGGNTITIRAISKTTTDWSVTMERTLVVKDMPDDINSVSANQLVTNQGIYDISGRKMADNATLSKGIYIINGKKVLVK